MATKERERERDRVLTDCRKKTGTKTMQMGSREQDGWKERNEAMKSEAMKMDNSKKKKKMYATTTTDKMMGDNSAKRESN